MFGVSIKTEISNEQASQTQEGEPEILF
jgi:hypothetical protein